jgi:prepilin-type N-terminal cleavage/methylation domain-containing protein
MNGKALIRRRKGFSLIEVAIVLGIIGLVIGGIWVASAAVQTNLREAIASEGLLQIVQNVRSNYNGQSPSATADITADLVSTLSIPADLLQGTQTRTPWNTAITVALDNSSGLVDRFTVTFAAVPRVSCVELVARNTNITIGTGLVNIVVNGGTATTLTTFPVDPPTAVAACASPTANTITWLWTIRG